MLKKRILFSSIVFYMWLVISLLSQRGAYANDDEIQTAANAVGISVSRITGVGLVYRRYWEDSFVQLGFLGGMNMGETLAGETNNRIKKVTSTTTLAVGRRLLTTRQPNYLVPLEVSAVLGANIRYQHLSGLLPPTDQVGGNISVMSDERKNYALDLAAGLVYGFGNIGRRGLGYSIDVGYGLSYEIHRNGFEYQQVGPVGGLACFFKW